MDIFNLFDFYKQTAKIHIYAWKSDAMFSLVIKKINLKKQKTNNVVSMWIISYII